MPKPPIKNTKQPVRQLQSVMQRQAVVKPKAAPAPKPAARAQKEIAAARLAQETFAMQQRGMGGGRLFSPRPAPQMGGGPTDQYTEPWQGIVQNFGTVRDWYNSGDPDQQLSRQGILVNAILKALGSPFHQDTGFHF